MNTAQLTHFETAKRELEFARSIDEVKGIRDKAEALRAYAKQAGETLDMQNAMAEIKLRAERRAGELLGEMEKRQPGPLPVDRSRDVTDLPPKLEDIGISKMQSSRWQQIAKLPEVKFEQHITAVKDAGEELTTAGLLREINPELSGKHKPKTNRAGDEYVPQGFDACQTPGYAIDPLCRYIDPAWTVWEPAAGEGFLVEALYDCGIHEDNVIRSDILTGQNFFEYLPDQPWDCLITNPPYSIKYRWIDRCYEIGKPFALLLPVETLGAKTAQVFFREKGLEVIFLDKRINFKMPNIGWEGSAAQFPTAWFTWGLNIGQQMTFAELKHGD